MNAVQPTRCGKITLPYRMPDPRQGQELSEREHEVMLELCRGRTKKEIAASLFVSVKTIEKHVQNIHVKWGCRNTFAVLHEAIRRGHYEIEGPWLGNPS